jgi:Zn-dependent M28 family amino/carboxypeptidase
MTGTSLPAQTTADLTKAAEVVTAQGMSRHIGVLAHDSMQGRDTPSRGLERTAQYVADEFSKLGLKPGSQAGGFIERYPIPRPLDFARSQIAFAGGGKSASVSLANPGVRLGTTAVPKQPAGASVVLVAGRHTPGTLDEAGIKDKIVLYVMPSQFDADDQEMIIRQLTSAGQGVVILASQDSASFAGGRPQASQPSAIRIGKHWALYIRPEAVAGLHSILTSGGIDLAVARTNTTPIVRTISSVQVSLNPRFEPTASDTATAPNVIAVLEGSDPKLKNEYLVFSAHMDHRADSLGGADDNASGVAALLELAKAYSRPGARPKRSLAFLATSGSARGLWGSHAFADQAAMTRKLNQVFGSSGGVLRMSGTSVKVKQETSGTSLVTAGATGTRKERPAVSDSGKSTPVRKTPTQPRSQPRSKVPAALFTGQVGFNINLDMIGRAAGDSVTIDGLRDTELPTSPTWIAAAHPELRLSIADGGTAASPLSDHFAFIRQGIPSLFFHNGVHEDRPAAAAIDAELAARISRLAFYVGHDIANAEQLPKWTTEGRRHYLKSLRE